MRTFYEPDEDEEFEAAKDLIVRRCAAWAAERGSRADEAVLAAALDSRHVSVDGRLAYWGRDQVRRFLCEYVPRHIIADQDVLERAPESLLTLLRHLADTGLLDPRGLDPDALPAAISEAAADYPDIVADPRRQSLAKYWTLLALDHGVDLEDQDALDRFQQDIDAGRVPCDHELLDELAIAQFLGEDQEDGRAFAQPPVALPPPAEVAEAAARSETVRRLTLLYEWADDQPLTAKGRLRAADARELAALLGVESPQMLLAWARTAGLVRVVKGRLRRIAKAAPLVRDPEALWRRAFERFFELGAEIGTGDSILSEWFDEIIPDVLNTLYGMPSPLPVARLQETVWLACQEKYLVEDDEHWRAGVDADLDAAFAALATLGAVELTHGIADALYSSDLRPSDDGDEPPPLPPEVCERLLVVLAEPGPLVHLTPLGTSATRARMLADGRDVPLLGELAGAPPAGLLGVLAQHYPEEEAAIELAGWLSAHDGDTEPLLQAVRDCPYRTRASAMLAVLAGAHPDGPALLTRLRHDRVIGPIAMTALVEEGRLSHDDLTADDQLAMLTEAMLALLEMGGPEAVHDQLATLPTPAAHELVQAVATSPHPAPTALTDFHTLIATPLLRPH
ncbi:hypothetical protein DP939_31375 [Spongiactinospora rosea]|uniref:Uncharacterized protein n=1 Tax=Spongiactinospora rosea TaxID=2248750 RepID=A0A366LQP4_9ACTN|nr:hypothetical protein [Spongiactinospora rosea]RBQ16127.1 hypothetical protein DP939_31375 [Spongiactinospora rosea]